MRIRIVKNPSFEGSPSSTAILAPGASESGTAFHSIPPGPYRAQVPLGSMSFARRPAPGTNGLASPPNTTTTMAAMRFMRRFLLTLGCRDIAPGAERVPEERHDPRSRLGVDGRAIGRGRDVDAYRG